MSKCIVFLLLTGLAGAQTKPLEAPVPNEVVYEFKHVTTERMNQIVPFVGSLLGNRVQIQVNNAFKTAIIQGNDKTADLLDKAVELFKRYDVPPAPESAEPQVDFIAYLVQASRLKPGEAAPAGQPIPPVLQEAVAEMKKTFSYSDYTLLDTIPAEVHHNTTVTNILPGRSENGNGLPLFYEIKFNQTIVSPDRKTISIDPFEFNVQIPIRNPTAPGAPEYKTTGISTYVAIHEGEKLVIGKARTGVNDTSDIFLVLTAKLR